MVFAFCKQATEPCRAGTKCRLNLSERSIRHTVAVLVQGRRSCRTSVVRDCFGILALWAERRKGYDIGLQVFTQDLGRYPEVIGRYLPDHRFP